MIQGYPSPGAFEILIPGNDSTGISASVMQPTSGIFKGQHAIGALITVENNTVNISIHGEAATATSGSNVAHAMTAGQSKVLESPHEVRQFRCIDAVSSSASKVKVTTYF